jgi:hypothetical protein
MSIGKFEGHYRERLLPALLRSDGVESDGRREALILGAAKKNNLNISPKTKAILKQHLNTTT